MLYHGQINDFDFPITWICLCQNALSCLLTSLLPISIQSCPDQPS